MEHYVPSMVLSALLLMWHDIFIETLGANIHYTYRSTEAPWFQVARHKATQVMTKPKFKLQSARFQNSIYGFYWNYYAVGIILTIKFLKNE